MCGFVIYMLLDRHCTIKSVGCKVKSAGGFNRLTVPGFLRYYWYAGERKKAVSMELKLI